MRFISLFFIILFGLATSTLAGDNDRPRVDRYAKGFVGTEGLEVVVLGIGKPENQEYLVQFSGINHDWDRKIFKAKKVSLDSEGRRHNYQIKQGGNTYNAIVVVERSYKVFLPKTKGNLDMVYDKSFSRSIRPQHFLTSFLEQK